ncbi:trithorax protein, putative [Medicago truncatula]|uniref:Trithorax protein, putative n=1 Tax=Medicago truncatula TaxID=3880 RepID=G7K493_MEDTR|nr:trithorax protein, putative [Medicago truncatula]
MCSSENGEPKTLSWYYVLEWNKNNGKLVLPKKVTVLCNSVEGIYFPSLHL